MEAREERMNASASSAFSALDPEKPTEKERFLYASLIPLSLEISLPIPLSVILL